MNTIVIVTQSSNCTEILNELSAILPTLLPNVEGKHNRPESVHVELSGLDKCLSENFEFGEGFRADPGDMVSAYNSAAKNYGLPDTNEFYGRYVKDYLHNHGAELKRPKFKDDNGKWMNGRRCWVGVRPKALQ